MKNVLLQFDSYEEKVVTLKHCNVMCKGPHGPSIITLSNNQSQSAELRRKQHVAQRLHLSKAILWKSYFVSMFCVFRPHQKTKCRQQTGFQKLRIAFPSTQCSCKRLAAIHLNMSMPHQEHSFTAPAWP